MVAVAVGSRCHISNYSLPMQPFPRLERFPVPRSGPFLFTQLGGNEESQEILGGSARCFPSVKVQERLLHSTPTNGNAAVAEMILKPGKISQMEQTKLLG
ncbi:hypothetical protein AVEN_101955-1 [Araneus ventricosus]|uniref:Uncharacterized protein n=1 Tax=Araneus ventricosus TaxID=182803 RepID=A0A4Y2K6S2_ARAVE|nr:hypothetical protein AVEN_101955-1 [Araneus ventricosus]